MVSIDAEEGALMNTDDTERFAVLRGKPIQVFTGDPTDIPCIETSDPEKLCKHPVVSVHMITYNHEPYIRQAIEGVMMQKTDFEFELVIGEDASTDKTREICFEYQKRYPDKIRVLWWHENLYRNPHPAGGNWRRNTAHCRGEFIAFCEGDDYWIDDHKLQKQVDMFKRNNEVGLCFCDADIVYDDISRVERWGKSCPFSPGKIDSIKFRIWHLFGHNPHQRPRNECFLMTATVMFRRALYEHVKTKYDILNWRLALGDSTKWLALASEWPVYYMHDVVSRYRQVATGACHASGGLVRLDSVLVRFYYAEKWWGLMPWHFSSSMIDSFVSAVYELHDRSYVCKIWNSEFRKLCLLPRAWIYYCLILCRVPYNRASRWIGRYRRRFPIIVVNSKLKKLFNQI